jgi:beta-lactamase class A
MKVLRRSFVLGLVAWASLYANQLWAEEDLAKKLQPLVVSHEGKVALAVKNLKTGESFLYNADVAMPTASLIKLPVMVEAYRQADAGKIDLQKLITLKEEDKVPGSGILTTHFSPGMSLPVADAIHLMMVYSDNTATNLVLDQIGLPATNATMEKLGLPNTKINSPVFKGKLTILPERSKQFGLGSTTAKEIIELLEQLDKGQLASESATKAMKRHLAMCDGKRLNKLLPSQLRVLQKTGSVTAVRTVGGIIELPSGNVVVCLLTNENKDRRWADDNAGEVLAAKVGRAIVEHFEPTGLVRRPAEPLRIGSQGVRVEKLQQALNGALKLTTPLIMDGEFGPQTQAAVIAWQKSRQLPETGEIDLEAWKRLGIAEPEFQQGP